MRKVLSTATAMLIATVGAGWASLLPANAANVPATCSNLPAKLSGAGFGDVITLHDTRLCNPGDGLPFTLPAGKSITLQGQTQQDGFDGTGTKQLLQGSNVGSVVIQNLTFKNGSGGGAGAIQITDSLLTDTSSPTVSNSIFLDNSGGGGPGAIELLVSQDVVMTGNTIGRPGHGNVGVGSGAVVVIGNHVVISNNQALSNSATGAGGFAGGGGLAAVANSNDANSLVFTNNQVTGNSTAGGNGGGAFLSASGTLTITGNAFQNNTIGTLTDHSPSGRGGGLAAQAAASSPTAQIVQSGNVFSGNVIHTQTFKPFKSSTPFDFGGGGEFAQSPLVTSTNDTMSGNRVDAGAGGNTAVGGGLALQGQSSNAMTTKTKLVGANLVDVNNSVGAGGEGGGIYAGFGIGCTAPPCTAEVDLFDATVSANSIGAGGTGQQMAGDTTDTARVVNSIVTGPVGAQQDIAGFGTIAVDHSDACTGGGAYAGNGNICKDPMLANVGGNDVHETSASPTVDTGDSTQVPSRLALDYYGVARVQGRAVDMGAAEAPVLIPSLPLSGQSSVLQPGLELWLGGFGLLVAIGLIASLGMVRYRGR